MPDDADRGTVPAYTTTTYRYKAVDGHGIKLDVHCTGKNAPRPAILWLHGGGLILGSRRMLPGDQASRYLAAGFTVIAIDYRLAPETKVAEIRTDVADACRWVERQSAVIGVDASRLALVGHSAGGYLALSMALRLQPPPQAVVSFYGYGDISGAWASQPNQFYRNQGLIGEDDAYQNIGTEVITASSVEARLKMYLYCRQQGIWVQKIVGDDYDNLELLRSDCCPLYAVTPDQPPTFLLHGDEDIDVPVSETLSLAQRFASLGVPHTRIILRGYGHGFDTAGKGLGDPKVEQVFATALSFLKRYV